MFSSMMSKAKSGAAAVQQKMDDREVSVQAGWRKEVMNDPESLSDPQWKQFEEWKTIYEPKTGKGAKSSIMAAAENHARKSMLKSVHDSMCKSMLTMLTEVASQLLGSTEQQLRSSQKDEGTGAGEDSAKEFGSVVSCLNGVVLTYRFGFNKRRRFPYLRRVASDRLTTTVVAILDAAGPDSGAKMAEIQAALVACVEGKQEEARAMLAERLQDMMSEGTAFNAEIGDEGGPLSARVDMGSVASPEASDEMIKRLGGFASELALSKMGAITVTMAKLIEDVLGGVHEAYLAAKASGSLDNEQGQVALEEDVYGKITGHYSTVYSLVSAQVSGLVGFLDTMMGADDKSED